MSKVKVYNASNNIETDMLIKMLEENGISAYASESRAGEYLKITQGFSIYGKDIYVDEEDLKTSRSIIEELLKSSDENDYTEDEKDGKEATDISWYKNKTVIARLVLACGVIIVIVCGIINMI